MNFILNIAPYGIAIGIGILGGLLSKKVGFQTPLIDALKSRSQRFKIFWQIFVPSVGYGVLVALVIILLDHFVFGGFGVSRVRIWQSDPLGIRILAVIFNGIFEEIVFRLGIMTLIIWIFTKLNHSPSVTPRQVTTGIVLSALVFGAAHISAAATPYLMFRSVILNGFAGIVFGRLYRRYGIESAMIAHIVADGMFYVVLASFV